MAYGCFIAEVDQKKHFLFKHNDACVFFLRTLIKTQEFSAIGNRLR